MTFAAHVKGGTGAGRKRLREPDAWECNCFTPQEGGTVTRSARALKGWQHTRGEYVEQPGSRYSCPDCGARRP